MLTAGSVDGERARPAAFPLPAHPSYFFRLNTALTGAMVASLIVTV